MLLVNNLSFSRDETKIFEDLNLSLSNKKIIQIKGRNGSGKTTFLKVVLNILEPSSGEIIWKGKNIKKIFLNFIIKQHLLWITILQQESCQWKIILIFGKGYHHLN